MTESLKSVIVTGAGRGIGACIAERLARDGYFVVAVDVLADAVASVASDLGDQGLQVLALECDVASESAVAAAVSAAGGEGRTLWGAVNCAAISGVHAKSPFLSLTADAWRRIVDVNLTGVFLVSQAVARVLSERGAGVIINISSVSGIGAEEDATAYCASKAGVIGLTRAMSIDLAPAGIRVCAVAPGDIDTARSREVAAATESRLPKVTPLGAGQPRDVAATVAFLLSDEARFISGTIIVVDGALMAY